MKELDAQDWAVSDFLRDRTVRILDFTNKKDGGTGIKLKLRDKYFIATAAHVVPDNRDIRILVPRTANSFIRDYQEKAVDNEADVAFLELDEVSALKLGEHYVEADNVCVEFPEDTGWSTIACGYPGQLIEIEQNEIGAVKQNSYDFRSMVFFGSSIPKQDWPTKGFQVLPVDGRELFMNFDSKAEIEKLDLTTNPPTIQEISTKSFDPSGMSGGGVWSDSRPSGDEVWSPNPLLLGTVRSCNPKHGWLRSTRIKYLVDLIQSRYPDFEIGSGEPRDC